MTERRSIRRSRPPIRSAEEAVHADYGASDLYDIVGIKRGQFQTWLSDGSIKPSRMDQGLRVFGFDALAMAAIAKVIIQRFGRIDIRMIMEDLANQLANENWRDLATRNGGKVFRIEVFDVAAADVGEDTGSDLTTEDIGGSPVSVDIKVNVGNIAARLIRLSSAEEIRSSPPRSATCMATKSR